MECMARCSNAMPHGEWSGKPEKGQGSGWVAKAAASQLWGQGRGATERNRVVRTDGGGV